MRKLIGAIAIMVALGFGYWSAPAVANTPNPAYCTPPNTLSPGGQVQSSPLNQNFQHAETCSGQGGDFFSDGPIYTATAVVSGYNFTIPANVWYVVGARVYAGQITEVAPASATSYWWLDNTTGQWTMTLTNTAPTATSTLGYTVISDNVSIDSATPVAQTTATFASVSIKTLTITNSLSLPATITVVSMIANSPGASPPLSLSSGDIDVAESNTAGRIFLGGIGSDCIADYGVTTANVLTISCPTTISGAIAASEIKQTSAGQFAGTCTNSSGATCTLTLGTSFSNPLCFAVDENSASSVSATCSVTGSVVTVTNMGKDFAGSCNTSSSSTCTLSTPYGFTNPFCISQQTTLPGQNSICSLSSTTITVTVQTNTTQTYNVMLRGQPTATGHVFNVLVIGNPN